MSRFRRILRRWPWFLATFLALLLYAAWPGRSTFTISPETTYVTEPVDAQGYIDYPTALNERMSKGITPENNANVLIWQALGPHPEGGTMPTEYFKWLGIESPPENGEYFVDSDKYFKANLATPPDNMFGFFQDPEDWKQQWEDRLSRARKWPWKRGEQPEIAKWLRQNEKPLALVIEASKRPQYWNPLVPKSKDPREARLVACLMPSMQKCRGVANALKCRAMARAADGDTEGAWQDLLACQKLGRLLSRGGTLIESLVGIAIVAIASDGELTLASNSKASAKQLLVWLHDLQKLPPFMSFADKLDLGERFVMLDSMQSIACLGTYQLDKVHGRASSAGPSEDFWDKLFTRNIDWDTAFRNAKEVFDLCVALYRIPDRATRKQESKKLTDKLEEMEAFVKDHGGLKQVYMGRAARGERVGNLLILLLLPSLQKLKDSSDRSEQTQLNLQLAFALAAFRADNSRYPARLDELAPKYLAEIPDDLFSGKPLIYKPSEKGYLLYSVGVNGIDEDGRWMDDEPKGDDLRVRMPAPEPKK